MFFYSWNGFVIQKRIFLLQAKKRLHLCRWDKDRIPLSKMLFAKKKYDQTEKKRRRKGALCHGKNIVCHVYAYVLSVPYLPAACQITRLFSLKRWFLSLSLFWLPPVWPNFHWHCRFCSMFAHILFAVNQNDSNGRAWKQCKLIQR